MSTLKERFENYSKQPDDRVWQTINKTMRSRTLRRRAITAASVSAAAVALAAVLLVNRDGSTPQLSDRQLAYAPVEQTVKAVVTDKTVVTENVNVEPQAAELKELASVLLEPEVLYSDDEVVYLPKDNNVVSAPSAMPSQPVEQMVPQPVVETETAVQSAVVSAGTEVVAEEVSANQSELKAESAVSQRPKVKAANDSLVVMVPNAFSPNDYGADPEVRVFKVYPNTDATILSYKIYIYSRSGRLVYHSTDINGAWDGRSRGADQPMGVYTYILEVTDAVKGIQHKKGTVTLLR